ncbi:MAG: hypothetical protein OXT74_01015 [Candidatus Poribacteria bacterium]|nr:hypothetical protein [Candidatus Poribacteria bacterium]
MEKRKGLNKHQKNSIAAAKTVYEATTLNIIFQWQILQTQEKELLLWGISVLAVFGNESAQYGKHYIVGFKIPTLKYGRPPSMDLKMVGARTIPCSNQFLRKSRNRKHIRNRVSRP